MFSWQVTEHGKPLQKVLQDTPRPSGTEVLVRVTRAGVCHSDLHIWDGYFDWGGGKRFYVKDRGCVPPFTLGHEPFGVVEAMGPAAAKAATPSAIAAPSNPETYRMIPSPNVGTCRWLGTIHRQEALVPCGMC